MVDANSIAYGIIFLISFLGAVVTSLTVATDKLWIPIICCIVAGVTSGIYMGGIQTGLLPGFLLNCIFIIAIIPGSRITRHLKIRAAQKLKK